MKKRRLSSTGNLLLAAAVVGVATSSLWAGGTGSSQLFMPQGSDAGTANGDYLSTNAGAGGLALPYRYFVEVPAGATRLVVDLFDADWGAGGGGEEAANRDRDRGGGGFTGTATYSVFDPSGIQAATGTSASFGSDNAWSTLYDTNSSAPFVNGVLTNTTTGATSLSVTVPAGGAGDLLVATITTLGLQDVTLTGWNLLQQLNCSADCRVEVFYKTSVASEPAVNFTWGLSAGAAGAVYRISGASVALPGSGTAAGNSATPTAPALAGAGNRLILRIAGKADNDFTAAPAGHTSDFLLNVNPAGTDVGFGGANQRINGAAAAASFTTGSADPWAAVTVGIGPGGSPTAGHWQVVVDQSASGSNNLNAVGIRGHDGTSGGGGTEYPVYYDSHTQIGTNDQAGAPSTRTYDVFPYLTSGCTAFVSHFDFDNGNGTGSGPGNAHGEIRLSSRDGTFSQTITSANLSGDDEWDSDTINRWGTDTFARGYGLWSADLQIWEYSGGNSNYANVYFRNNPGSAAPPPTANPSTASFRVYLMTDSGGTPVKPYLEQQLTWQSGPNPPDTGQVTRFQVTVRLVNPTAQAITFSTPTNIVTARVPGAGAVYAGNAAVSQGSIVSQPAIGGTGDVTWNPGTVAAGTTQLLTYRVDVTPPANGARVVVTGTPASNGTRAQYVDETGNTTQARATYLQGPLCELAITEGLLTKALVTDLQAVAERGRVAVEWATTTEDGTAAFDLYRWSAKADDWVLVNAEPVMAAPDSVQGARYRVVDAGASAGEELTYSLVEFESLGGSREAGRFTVVAGERRGEAAPFRGDLAVERLATPAPGIELARLAADSERRTAAGRLVPDRLPAPSAGGKFKAIVRERGLYRITIAELRTYLGLASDRLALAYLQAGQFRVENRGLPVAWSRANVGGTHALYFFGEEANSIYTDDNVYWVSVGAGPRMRAVEVGAGASGGTTFVDRLDVETDAFAATVVSSDPESDYWYWTYLVGDSGSDGARDLSFDLVDAVTAGDASLTVRFKGATATGVADEHEADLFVNGVAIGSTSWTGITDHSVTFDFTASILQAGANTLRIEAFAGPGAPYSVYYVDGFEVASPRLLQAAAGALELTGGGATTVEVSGFAPNSLLRLFDLTDTRSPRIVNGAAIAPAGTSVRFDPESPATPYLAVALASAMAPAELRVDTPSSLRAAKGAEYVVVSDADLAPAAAQFAAHRGSQGLAALAVRLEDVYDEFSFGLATPHALRDFAAWAATEWETPLRYLALAGDGHLDPRNHLGLGGNRIPVMMVATPSGLFASDSAFGDFDEDGMAEIAVGRLPALSNSELTALLAKTQAHESLAGDWADRVVLVADNADGAASFIADSDQVESLLGAGYDVSKIHLGPLTAAEAHDALVAAFQAGAGHVHYFGHGGLDRFADESILANSDVPALGNGGQAPLLTALSCAINRFELPGFPALGEELVRRVEGGAVAVFAPSGLGHHGAATELSSRLAVAVYGSGPARSGDAFLEAGDAFASAGGDRELLRLYTHIGDPALLLRRPAPPADDPEPTSGE